MGKPSAPSAPDPVALANAQGAANKETAITQARINAVNSVSPFGSVTYKESNNYVPEHWDDATQSWIPAVGDPETPQFTQETKLSPEQQGLYTSLTGLEQNALDTAKSGIGNVQSTLAQPFTLNGLPSLVSSVNSPNLQSGYQSVSPVFGISPSGPIQSTYGSAGPVQTSVDRTSFSGNVADVGQQQRNVATSGQVTSFGDVGGVQGAAAPTGQRSVLPGAGPIAGSVSPTGQTTSLAPSGSIQGGLDYSNLPALPGVNDFSAERQRVEDAYMGRFNQDIGRQEEDQISRLNAEGLQRGSAAYNNAMDTLNRERVDARNAAIQAGGAEQSRLFNLASQARSQLAGEAQTAGNFANSAQAQRYGQALSSGQFENDALSNAFGQNLAAGNFANAAQAQGFGQNLAGGQFENAALSDLYRQNAASVDQANAAQQQQFGQAQARGEFENAARNAQFQQGVTAGNFGNAAQQADFSQALSRLNAQNSAAESTFGQNVTAGAFGNQAQQQILADLLSRAQFGNQAQQQQFGQNQSLADFYNTSAAQATAQNQGAASFFNTAQQQQYNQDAQNAALQNQARQQGIGEQQLVRSQPINELATLLGLGGNVQVPNSAPNFGVGVQPTDVLGAYGMQQQALQNSYNQQMAANNALWGGLGNLGGSLGAAWIMSSDLRVKNIIRRVGETKTGIPLYLYEFKDKPGVQVVGVIAQEFRHYRPFAVNDTDGILRVDYAEVA